MVDKPKSEWYVQQRSLNRWAVVKKGNSRATNICYSLDVAVALADALSKGKFYRGSVVDICDISGNVISTRTMFKPMEESEEDE